jgi:uncharacterized RDD family membrane protein YckC
MIRWRRRELEPHARGAGFWRRRLAWSIDLLAGIAVTALVSGWSPGLATLVLLGYLLAYWPLMEHSRLHGTLGKLALGLAMLDERGQGISLRRCAVRHLLRWLSIITLVSAMLAGWTRRRQALHDLISDTVVVRAA